MANKDKDKLTTIAIGSLNRKNLYELFFERYTPSIRIEDIDNKELASEVDGVRYKAEKLIFMNLLLDYDLDAQIERRKNTKYDYLIGLLLYITSNSHFKYGFGYFIDSIQHFDNFLSVWCEFINSVISDINSLDTITFARIVFIQFAGILQIEISGDSIIDIVVNIDRFNAIFGKWSNKYDFNIIVDGHSSDWINRNVIFSGTSDGSGRQSKICECIKQLNNYFELMLLKRDMLISFTHGN